MNVFEVVKENVTARQAAEAYGLKVGRTGMACCPFHSDKSPSMKLDERYYCFGCGATGDAVDLTAKLFGIGLREAAVKLAEDFGLNYDSRQKPSVRPRIREPTPEQKYQKGENHCYKVLTDYFHLLREWEKKYAPKQPDEEWNPLFAEALHGGQAMTTINLKDFYYWYLTDVLVEVPDEVAEELIASKRREAAHAERVRYNKAYYSLDCDDGIEYSACLHEPSPQELMDRKELFFRLWNALNSLPEIQGRRVDAHLILGKSYRQIAREEGVDKSAVRCSVKCGIERMKKYLQENF